MRNLIRLALELGHKLFSRVRAMGRMGRRVTPGAPVWGWALIWLRSSFLPSQNYLIILAVVVGILTGFGSVGFVMVLHTIADFARGTASQALAIFGPAQLVLLPALGGLMVGPLINRFAKEAKGHGVPEVMTALATRGGFIRTRVVMVKVIASSLTIGFGGTAGREGPMVQIGAALGSAIGRWARLTAKNIRTLVACGAAGGVAATFNAPIAGAIFAMEVLMGRIQTDFLLVLLTSLSSSIIARHYLGNAPAVLSPSYYLVSPGELPLYFLMGIIIGVAAVYYVKLLYASEDYFSNWNFPEYLKPAVGGLPRRADLTVFPRGVRLRVSGDRIRALDSLYLGVPTLPICRGDDSELRDAGLGRVGRRFCAEPLYGCDVGGLVRRGGALDVSRLDGDFRCIRDGRHGSVLRSGGEGSYDLDSDSL